MQCSPYQAVTGKIYRLKQHLSPPATAEGLLKIHIVSLKKHKLWSDPIKEVNEYVEKY